MHNIGTYSTLPLFSLSQLHNIVLGLLKSLRISCEEDFPCLEHDFIAEHFSPFEGVYFVIEKLSDFVEIFATIRYLLSVVFNAMDSLLDLILDLLRVDHWTINFESVCELLKLKLYSEVILSLNFLNYLGSIIHHLQKFVFGERQLYDIRGEQTSDDFLSLYEIRLVWTMTNDQNFLFISKTSIYDPKIEQRILNFKFIYL
jgi:hypothetical protein